MEFEWAHRTPDSWVRSFELLRPHFERYATTLGTLIEQLLAAEQITYELVQTRVESAQSFREKLERKPGKYTNPLAEIPDIVGIRIVVHFRADVERVRRLIERELEVDATQTRDPDESSSPEAFGYRSLHLVVRPDVRRASLPEWAEHGGKTAEIQVRTVLDHTWAAIDHRLRYKREDTIAPEIRSLNARVAAILQDADDRFDELRQAVLAAEPIHVTGLPTPPLADLELGRYLTESGTKERWWRIALENGFLADPSLERDDAATFAQGSLAYLTTVLAALGIVSIEALDSVLGRISDTRHKPRSLSSALLPARATRRVTTYKSTPTTRSALSFIRNIGFRPLPLSISLSTPRWTSSAPSDRGG